MMLVGGRFSTEPRANMEPSERLRVLSSALDRAYGKTTHPYVTTTLEGDIRHTVIIRMDEVLSKGFGGFGSGMVVEPSPNFVVGDFGCHAWTGYKVGLKFFGGGAMLPSPSAVTDISDAVIIPVGNADIVRRFYRDVEEWRAQSDFLSSINEMCMLPAYQRIIGLGPAAIPLLLNELTREPDYWFWALSAITDEDPVPEQAQGDIDAMTKAWIAWGEDRGYGIRRRKEDRISMVPQAAEATPRIHER